MSKDLVYSKLDSRGAEVGFVSVIMAGGQGIRFWPLSRRNFPKQFLPVPSRNLDRRVGVSEVEFGNEESLIGLTARRMAQIESFVTDRLSSHSVSEQTKSLGHILVVTGRDHVDLVKERLCDASILGEPIGRNTAPCAAYAARYVLDNIGDVPLLTVPADHLIANEDHLLNLLVKGMQIANSEDVLLTIGLCPESPEVGYGYIERGDPLGDVCNAYSVKRFVEKPDLATAQGYLESCQYYWNSGMFVWRPSVFLNQVDKYLPELGEQMRLFTPRWLDGISSENKKKEEFNRFAEEIFNKISPVSVDVGIMEKADNVVMLSEGKEKIGWSDVGSWSAWADSAAELNGSLGSSENIIKADSVLLDSDGCVLLGDKKLIAGIGLHDLIIIDTEDALLIVPRNRTQDVRRIVDELKVRGRVDLL